jgi:hypothetical protein
MPVQDETDGIWNSNKGRSKASPGIFQMGCGTEGVVAENYELLLQPIKNVYIDGPRAAGLCNETQIWLNLTGFNSSNIFYISFLSKFI